MSPSRVIVFLRTFSSKVILRASPLACFSSHTSEVPSTYLNALESACAEPCRGCTSTRDSAGAHQPPWDWAICSARETTAGGSTDSLTELRGMKVVLLASCPLLISVLPTSRSSTITLCSLAPAAISSAVAWRSSLMPISSATRPCTLAAGTGQEGWYLNCSDVRDAPNMSHRDCSWRSCCNSWALPCSRSISDCAGSCERRCSMATLCCCSPSYSCL